MTDLATQTKQYLAAGYQSLVVDTSEIARCEDEIIGLCASGSVDMVLSWDCVGGLIVRSVSDACPDYKSDVGKRITSAKAGPGQPTISDPLQALRTILSELPVENAVIIMHNLHLFLKKDVEVGQLWQTSVNSRQFNGLYTDSETGCARPICRVPIIVGTGVDIQPSLKPTVTYMTFSLPDLDDMRKLHVEVQQAVEDDRARLELRPDPATPELAERISRSLLGMTRTEATGVLSLCGVLYRSLGNTDILDTIESEKAAILKKNNALAYISRAAISRLPRVGGFSEFKKWLKRRCLCYTKAADDLRIDKPKGVILLGVPGSGKSAVAKESAEILGLPLVSLNVGALFGSLVGSSESQTDDTIRTIESLNGCVLLIDEADKAWQGSSGTATDSGVAQRVFGKFLTWLAEKKDNTFVIMTMNRIDGIPSELLRRGRFDELFYTTLPNSDEREEIIRLHLKHRNVDPDAVLKSAADWKRLLTVTDEFVGAELEQMVVESRLVAFSNRGAGEPTLEELVSVAKTVVKLVTLDRENLDRIMTFCKERARPVNDDIAATATKAPRAHRVSVSGNPNNN